MSNEVESPVASGANLAELDLAMVLEAFGSATDRLQQTHEALRLEVQRLTNELEAKNRELARRNRLAVVGQMASHVAHEMRNGMVPLTLYISMLQRKTTGIPSLKDIVDKFTIGFGLLQKTVNDLLHFAADREAQVAVVDLSLVARELLITIEPHLSGQRIQVTNLVPTGMTLWADDNMLRRAILNLLLNAIDALPDGGQIFLTATETQRGVEIRVADSGKGVPVDLLTNIFEPFFSTKNTGTGLGLSIVDRVAEAHLGGVEVRNQPNGGAEFTLWLPNKPLQAKAA